MSKKCDLTNFSINLGSVDILPSTKTQMRNSLKKLRLLTLNLTLLIGMISQIMVSVVCGEQGVFCCAGIFELRSFIIEYKNKHGKLLCYYSANSFNVWLVDWKP